MSKPKPVNFELIPTSVAEPYRLLKQMRSENHRDLSRARIALAWRKAFKPDKDGHLVLGKCVKASDLQRELAEYDFVILLNKEIWQDIQFTDDKKCALLDHELCHAAPALDEEEKQKMDEKGRAVWRVRKHDIEEFTGIIERHGCYKRDLERFAEALIKSKSGRLLFETGNKAASA